MYRNPGYSGYLGAGGISDKWIPHRSTIPLMDETTQEDLILLDQIFIPFFA